MFVARIALSHAFKKINKNFTEQLPSNIVSAQIFLMLWTLNAGAASSCSTFWIHALRACIWKHNILQFIYKSFKAISRFQSSYSNQQPPLPLLIGGMRCSAKQSLVLVMIFASFSDSFKYFHTADMFAAFVRASIWSCHVIVRYILFGLFTYSIRKSFFLLFSAKQFRLPNIQCIPSHNNSHEGYRRWTCALLAPLSTDQKCIRFIFP